MTRLSLALCVALLSPLCPAGDAPPKGCRMVSSMSPGAPVSEDCD